MFYGFWGNFLTCCHVLNAVVFALIFMLRATPCLAHEVRHFMFWCAGFISSIEFMSLESCNYTPYGYPDKRRVLWPRSH